jgi:hypothetical protein
VATKAVQCFHYLFAYIAITVPPLPIRVVQKSRPTRFFEAIFKDGRSSPVCLWELCPLLQAGEYAIINKVQSAKILSGRKLPLYRR